MNDFAQGRRQARELILQALFQQEFQPSHLIDSLEKLKSIFAIDEKVWNYAVSVGKGINTNLATIDAAITDLSKNWKLERMSLIDRNLLRIALYEIKYVGEVPDKVALNESLEIAKKYGSSDSVMFINGLLDQAIKEKA